MAGASTEAQRQMFGMNENFGGHGFNADMDHKSNRLRDAYISGQQMFRNTLASISGLEPTVDQLNDHLGMIKSPTDREGFMMGWQSDKYAYDNGLQLSVMGGERWQPEDNYGHSTQAEGRHVLDGSD